METQGIFTFEEGYGSENSLMSRGAAGLRMAVAIETPSVLVCALLGMMLGGVTNDGKDAVVIESKRSDLLVKKEGMSGLLRVGLLGKRVVVALDKGKREEILEKLGVSFTGVLAKHRTERGGGYEGDIDKKDGGQFYVDGKRPISCFSSSRSSVGNGRLLVYAKGNGDESLLLAEVEKIVRFLAPRILVPLGKEGCTVWMNSTLQMAARSMEKQVKVWQGKKEETSLDFDETNEKLTVAGIRMKSVLREEVESIFRGKKREKLMNSEKVLVGEVEVAENDGGRIGGKKMLTLMPKEGSLELTGLDKIDVLEASYGEELVLDGLDNLDKVRKHIACYSEMCNPIQCIVTGTIKAIREAARSLRCRQVVDSVSIIAGDEERPSEIVIDMKKKGIMMEALRALIEAGMMTPMGRDLERGEEAGLQMMSTGKWAFVDTVKGGQGGGEYSAGARLIILTACALESKVLIMGKDRENTEMAQMAIQELKARVEFKEGINAPKANFNEGMGKVIRDDVEGSMSLSETMMTAVRSMHTTASAVSFRKATLVMALSAMPEEGQRDKVSEKIRDVAREYGVDKKVVEYEASSAALGMESRGNKQTVKCATGAMVSGRTGVKLGTFAGGKVENVSILTMVKRMCQTALASVSVLQTAKKFNKETDKSQVQSSIGNLRSCLAPISSGKDTTMDITEALPPMRNEKDSWSRPGFLRGSDSDESPIGRVAGGFAELRMDSGLAMQKGRIEKKMVGENMAWTDAEEMANAIRGAIIDSFIDTCADGVIVHEDRGGSGVFVVIRDGMRDEVSIKEKEASKGGRKSDSGGARRKKKQLEGGFPGKMVEIECREVTEEDLNSPSRKDVDISEEGPSMMVAQLDREVSGGGKWVAVRNALDWGDKLSMFIRTIIGGVELRRIKAGKGYGTMQASADIRVKQETPKLSHDAEKKMFEVVNRVYTNSNCQLLHCLETNVSGSTDEAGFTGIITKGGNALGMNRPSQSKRLRRQPAYDTLPDRYRIGDGSRPSELMVSSACPSSLYTKSVSLTSVRKLEGDATDVASAGLMTVNWNLNLAGMDLKIGMNKRRTIIGMKHTSRSDNSVMMYVPTEAKSLGLSVSSIVGLIDEEGKTVERIGGDMFDRAKKMTVSSVEIAKLAFSARPRISEEEEGINIVGIGLIAREAAALWYTAELADKEEDLGMVVGKGGLEAVRGILGMMRGIHSVSEAMKKTGVSPSYKTLKFGMQLAVMGEYWCQVESDAGMVLTGDKGVVADKMRAECLRHSDPELRRRVNELIKEQSTVVDTQRKSNDEAGMTEKEKTLVGYIIDDMDEGSSRADTVDAVSSQMADMGMMLAGRKLNEAKEEVIRRIAGSEAEAEVSEAGGGFLDTSGAEALTQTWGLVCITTDQDQGQDVLVKGNGECLIEMIAFELDTSEKKEAFRKTGVMLDDSIIELGGMVVSEYEDDDEMVDFVTATITPGGVREVVNQGRLFVDINTGKIATVADDSMMLREMLIASEFIQGSTSLSTEDMKPYNRGS
jgi:hypothetical protein